MFAPRMKELGTADGQAHTFDGEAIFFLTEISITQVEI